MEAMDLEIPKYMKDVRPKIRDVMLTSQGRLQGSAPIFDLIKTYHTDKPSVVPIYEGERFKGLLSVDDITGWFLADNQEEIPTYEFSIDNILKVIPSTLIKKGREDVIRGSLAVGAASFETFTCFLDDIEECILVIWKRTINFICRYVKELLTFLK